MANLLHWQPNHGIIASLRLAVYNLLVSKHCPQLRAPVHRYLCLVGKTLLEKLQEDPLSPFVVSWICGGKLPVPVVREACSMLCRAKHEILPTLLCTG